MNLSRSKSIVALTLAIGLVVLSGCSRSTLMPIKALNTEARPYSSIRVSVESRVAEDVSKEISDLQGEILSELRELKRFDDVVLADSEKAAEGLLVKASIIGVRKVGGGARFFLGAFAGRASMSTDVEFVDAATGSSLGSYSIKEETGSSGVAGTTSESVKKTAKAIANLTAQHFSVPTSAKR